jgi:hypothetical protein
MKFLGNLFRRTTVDTLADGTMEWRRNNALHRGDGPAVIHPDGREEYWLKGKQLTTLADFLFSMPFVVLKKEPFSWRREIDDFRSALKEAREELCHDHPGPG